MSSLKPEPTRVTELADESEELAMLKSGVRMLRRQQGTPEQTAALAARLGPELATHVVAGTALLSSTLLRFALLGAGVVGMSVGAYWLWGRDAAEVAVTAPPAIAAPAAPLTPPVAAPPLEPAPLEAAQEAEPIAEPPARPVAIAAKSAPRADRAKAQAVDPEAELVLLGRAQALLDRDPNGALDVLSEHARSYGQGVFSEEREVLALEAESKLGHKALARARAERFMARFPRSAHARRVRTLLEPMR